MKGRAILMIGLFLIYSPTLLARSAGKYLGVALAQTRATVEDMTLETLPYSYLFTGSPNSFRASHDNSSTNSSWVIYAGYTFNRYLSLEALYQSMGEFTRDGHNSGLTSPFVTNAAGLGLNVNLGISDDDRLALSGYGITALATLPVDNYMSVFARFGGFYWSGKLDRSTTFYRGNLSGPKIKTIIATDTKSGLSPMLGIGLQLDVSRNVTIRGEWSRISGMGSGLATGKVNVNTASLGAQIYF